MITIGTMLDRQKGIGAGFDGLRIALAVGVVAWHVSYIVSGSLAGTSSIDQSWIIWLPSYAILVMFFGLSGFLIAASALRLSLKNFLINRGMRILPALAVEIVLSAFILGPIFTDLSLARYFGDAGVYRYFTNIVGLVNYVLPGVFAGSPAPEVNASLWTVPFEYLCYAIMAIAMLSGLLRRPKWIVAAAALLVLAGLGVQFIDHSAQATQAARATTTLAPLGKIFGPALLLGRGSRLLVAFLLGIAAFLYRHKLPYDRRLFALCCAICLGAAVLGPAPWMTQPILNATVCPALVYMTAFIGVSELPIGTLFSRGDYSYGIYLYGFPVQQSVRTMLPGASPINQFLVSILIIAIFAVFSWHVIEKPILGLRRRFSFMAKARLGSDTTTHGRAAQAGQTLGAPPLQGLSLPRV